jgi:hypothetical protein
MLMHLQGLNVKPFRSWAAVKQVFYQESCHVPTVQPTFMHIYYTLLIHTYIYKRNIMGKEQLWANSFGRENGYKPKVTRIKQRAANSMYWTLIRHLCISQACACSLISVHRYPYTSGIRRLITLQHTRNRKVKYEVNLQISDHRFQVLTFLYFLAKWKSLSMADYSINSVNKYYLYINTYPVLAFKI